MTEQRNTPDWERIEADYRAGLMSLREIAKPHGITETAIRKRAKRDGWERDLGAKIRARAEAKLHRKEFVPLSEPAYRVSEREIIEANAERIAQVRGEHRADITRARNQAQALLAELEAQPDRRQRFAELLSTGRVDEAHAMLSQLLDLPQNIKSLRELAETLKTLIGLEREAYGLDTAPGSDGTVFGRIERVIVRASDPHA